MAERPHELKQQTFVMQYDITLTYSMFTFSDRTLSPIKYRILLYQKTRSHHIKCADSIPVTQTSQIIISPNHQFRVLFTPSRVSVVKRARQL